MYCANCGSFLPDGTGFCPYCGATQDSQVQTPSFKPKEKNSAGKFVAIGIGLVVIIGIVLLGTSLFGSNEETPLKNYCRAFGDADAKALMKLYPEEVLKKRYNIRDLEDAEDFLDRCDFYDDDDYEVDYTIKQTEKLDKRTLEDFGDHMKETYRMDADDFSAAYLCQVRFASEEDGKRNASKTWVVTYKYDGKWYLELSTLSSCDAISELMDELS